MSAGLEMATAKPKSQKKKTSKAKAKAEVVTEKAVHRHVEQTFTASAYANMRKLPPGSGKALLMEAKDRRHRTELEWRKMWKDICDRPV